jgi:glycine cleavage system transcriptional repressor
MTLVVALEAPVEAVERALAPLSADGSLAVFVRALPEEADDGGGGTPYLLTVHGGDRPGIVSAVTRVVADAGGNITDLTTRLVGDLYVVIAEVDLPDGAEAGPLEAALRSVGESLGVGVSLRPGEPDVL